MFQDAFSVVPDPRMDRFLLRTFPQLVLVQVSYLLLVTKIGPYLMKNVEPFNLKRIMIVYNVVQIILNAYLFLMGLTIWDRVSVFCMNYDTTDDPTNLLILDLHHYYLLLKHLDLLETFFFVLRKKERQISFLHLYHHVNMLLAPWISARYFPGGHGYFVNFFNSFTHCIMYSYYLTSVCRPEIAQTKWKRYLTLVQINLTLLDHVSVFCSPSTQWSEQAVRRSLDLHHYYYLLKHADLIETVLFVLRKKQRQVSFLHVYHHEVMILAVWVSATYFPGGPSFFMETYNTFTHCVMYVYYLVTSFKPEIAKTSWKKCVTVVQISNQTNEQLSVASECVQMFSQSFNDLFPTIPDPRMDRFLLSTPLQLFSVMVAYMVLILKLGPAFMKNRSPLDLKNIIMCYNVVQIFANALLFVENITVWSHVTFSCMDYDKTENEVTQKSMDMHYHYLLLKYFDMLETVFFVLRKKHRQVSLLHVYHHEAILFAAWISGKYFPGGQGYFMSFYNTIMHCIMYIYYLASLYQPQIVNSKWKRYMTAVQIIQQVLVFVCFLPVMFNPNCSYPKGWTAVFLVNVLIVTGLFVKFYKNNYVDAIKPKTK